MAKGLSGLTEKVNALNKSLEKTTTKLDDVAKRTSQANAAISTRDQGILSKFGEEMHGTIVQQFFAAYVQLAYDNPSSPDLSKLQALIQQYGGTYGRQLPFGLVRRVMRYAKEHKINITADTFASGTGIQSIDLLLKQGRV